MSAQRRSYLSPAAVSKPDSVEEAWRHHCKYSAAGSWRAACKYVGSEWMPPSLRDFAEGGRYYKVDPPLKPMSGGDFEKWRRGWEQEQAWKAAWEKKHAWEGRSSGGAPRASDKEEEAEEGEDPLFLEAVAASKKDAADKARAEAEEAAQAIATVNELMAREAAATTPLIILDD
jgi:hypothetical protein